MTKKPPLLLPALSQQSIRSMSKEEKKSVAKVMTELGWGSRKIESWLGISDTTIQRALSIPTPDELKQFESDFRLSIQSMKNEGLALAIQRMLELLPKEKRMDVLIQVAQFFEGQSKNQGPGVAIQINTAVAEKKKEYDI